MDEKQVTTIYAKNRLLYSATIELCTTCNWNCKYCYLENHTEKGLSFEIITDLLHQLREAGCFDLTFTGGEIFTRKDTMQIIETARRLGFSVSLLTNLSLLSHAMLDSLKEMQIEGIDCSLFSLNPYIHDDFVESQGSFSKIYDNLFYCKKIGLNIRPSYTPMTINQGEFSLLVQFAETFGFPLKTDCQILPSLNPNVDTQQYALSGERFERALVVSDKIMGVEYHHEEDAYLCGRTHNSIWIKANGDVMLCHLLGFAVGNILTSALSELLAASDELPSFAQIKYAKWSDLTEECKTCPDNQYCIRCPGLIHLEGKDRLGCSPMSHQFARARHSFSESGRNDEKNSD